MKKFIVIFFMTIIHSNADYISSGSADSKGEAYIQAMSQAPSGNHWILSNVEYTKGYLDRYVCKVTWTIKK